MAELRINLQDLHAVLDVLCDVAESADSMTTEQARDFQRALDAIAKKAKEASGLMKTQVINTLEGQPRRIGDTIIAAKPTGKWRPNHTRIKSIVISRSIYDADGAMRDDVEQTAAIAVDLIYDLFVAPSDAPKQTGLKKLGLENPDVCDWERTGTELKEMSVDGGPE